MKKIIASILLSTLAVQLAFFTAFAESTLSFSLATDQEGYLVGDYVKVEIISDSSLSNGLSGARIRLKYDADLIEYVEESDIGYKTIFDVNEAYFCNIPEAYTGISKKPGILGVSIAGAEPLHVEEGEVIYTAIFKVKDTIYGARTTNFVWDTTNNNYYSYVGWSEEQIDPDYYYSLKFKSKQIRINGADLGSEESVLQQTAIFNPEKVPGEENPLIINIDKKTVKKITTPYGVAYSKIPVRNSYFVKAGILFSKKPLTEAEFLKGAEEVKEAEALNFSVVNDFGILFYGNGIQPGMTYYTRAYVEYEDTILYAPVSTFTTPSLME